MIFHFLFYNYFVAHELSGVVLIIIKSAPPIGFSTHHHESINIHLLLHVQVSIEAKPIRHCLNRILRSFTIDTHVCEATQVERPIAPVTQDSLVPITALINPISQHTITIAFVVVAAIVV